MDIATAQMINELAGDHSDLPMTLIVRVVTDCAAQPPSRDPAEVARSAREALAITSRDFRPAAACRSSSSLFPWVPTNSQGR